MSRIGKMPIKLAPGVSARLNGEIIEVKGKLGNLDQRIPAGVTVEIGKEEIVVRRDSDCRRDRALHGLIRSLIQNMVTGVEEGFKKILRVNGVGYKAVVSGKTLQLTLGFSHDVKYVAPDGIIFAVNDKQITVSGNDKQAVGQAAADIRAFRPPEPYKGKGIFYKDEKIIRKAGKAGIKA